MLWISIGTLNQLLLLKLGSCCLIGCTSKYFNIAIINRIWNIDSVQFAGSPGRAAYYHSNTMLNKSVRSIITSSAIWLKSPANLGIRIFSCDLHQLRTQVGQEAMLCHKLESVDGIKHQRIQHSHRCLSLATLVPEVRHYLLYSRFGHSFHPSML